MRLIGVAVATVGIFFAALALMPSTALGVACSSFPNQAAAPLVVMGDFNQRLPRKRQPQHVHESLVVALAPLAVLTAGAEPPPGLARQEVDHIAVSSHFAPELIWGVDRHDGSRCLSDHDAVLVRARIG